MRYLIAKLLNLELANVQFALGFERRFVYTYLDGTKYVRLYGDRIIIEPNNSWRTVYWIRRKSSPAGDHDE